MPIAAECSDRVLSSARSYWTEPGAQLCGEIYREFTIVNVIAASMTKQEADALAHNSRVNYVEPDYLMYAIEPVTINTTDEITVGSAPWGIERVFADEDYSFPTWETSTGDGVAVAILDSGITEHIDLIIAGGYNAFDEEGYEDIWRWCGPL